MNGPPHEWTGDCGIAVSADDDCGGDPFEAQTHGQIDLRLRESIESVRENVLTTRLVVMRSGDTTATATVNYSFIPETAKTPDDFTSTPATLTFDPGETFASFDVPISQDTADEPIETFVAVLTKAPLETFTIDPALAQAIVSIIDND